MGNNGRNLQFMLGELPTNCGDDTCSSCVVAGDFIFLAYHGGGQNKEYIFMIKN